MLEIDIPNGPSLRLEHLVCDLNGTLARDGLLLEGVAERLKRLSERLAVCILSADTNDTASGLARELGVRVERLGPGRGDEQKLAFVRSLGPEGCCAVGNGRNDALMLRQAALALVVIGPEGAAREALEAGHVICYRPVEALDLLLHPNRLIATLRS
jgi:soluble P-type ATPase